MPSLEGHRQAFACSSREFQLAPVNSGKWRLTGLDRLTWVNAQVGVWLCGGLGSVGRPGQVL